MEMIRLRRSGEAVMLTAPEGNFSYFHPRCLFTGLGWDAETASLLLLKRPVKALLILGLGGGTVARQCRALFPDAEITGVEINQRVVELAYEHFNLDSLKINAVVMPGQLFLAKSLHRFDAIIDDMWLPEPQSPKPVLVDPRWIDLVSSRLKPSGM
jgi:spermidine synthase